MSSLEYLLAAGLLRLVGLVCSLLPIDPERVVLASPRSPRLEGNLRHLHEAIRARHPDLRQVVLVEPYGYSLRSKLAYLLRVVRGMVQLCRARLFIVDNAYLPVHVRPHRKGTTVVQVWHAVSAVKRFGLDTTTPLREPERTFLHRYYDYVVVSSEGVRAAYANALRTPRERVLALGTPRTDLFFDPAAMEAARQRVLREQPALQGRRVVVYAPTFRGRGRTKRPAPGLDAVRLRAALPPEYALVLKMHPNVESEGLSTAGYDVVIDRAAELNELLCLTDVLVTDYSAAIFEYALLRRPLVLLLPDLGDYERDPGMLVDYRDEMIGTQVRDTDGVAAAILTGGFDLSGYDAFIERHAGACDGAASERFVQTFIG
jgi:CDP-ribitol ribitolphosphotransferase